jgi:hypothetical protein
MSIDTTARGLTGRAGDAGAREPARPAGAGPAGSARAAPPAGPAGPGAVPYCARCGHWAVPAMDRGWEHVRGNGGRGLYGAGHEVEVAWCAPPAASVSPAQHEQLLAALDDAIAYREHAAASGYATAYRMLRRQLASPARDQA